MKLTRRFVVRTTRRLSEAAGYLELGLTRQALACLDRVGNPGPFAAAVELLRGEAARRERRFDDAAVSFEIAARLLPAPSNKPLWLAASRYQRETGNVDRAIQSLAHARGALPPSPTPRMN